MWYGQAAGTGTPWNVFSVVVPPRSCLFNALNAQELPRIVLKPRKVFKLWAITAPKEWVLWKSNYVQNQWTCDWEGRGTALLGTTPWHPWCTGQGKGGAGGGTVVTPTHRKKSEFITAHLHLAKLPFLPKYLFKPDSRNGSVSSLISAPSATEETFLLT